MKRLLSLVLLVLFASIATAYSDRSFSMEVQLQPDGGTHVVEKSFFVLDNKNEIEAFEFILRQGKTTLADWQKFSRNIRYHLLGSVFNLRIVAAREFQTGFTTASVTIEYDVKNVLKVNQTSSRTTHYVLDAEKLLLGSSRGDITLGNNMVFALHVPPDAIHLVVTPDAGASRNANAIRWVGPTSGRWEVSFDREITLAQEVQAFFVDLFNLLSSSYVLWLLLAVVFAIVVYKIVKTRKR